MRQFCGKIEGEALRRLVIVVTILIPRRCIMGDKPERFEVCGSEGAWAKYLQDGTEGELPAAPADEVLNAIAEARDIDIGYAIIEGDMDTHKIRRHIMCNVRISHSEIRANADFSEATFSGRARFIFRGLRTEVPANSRDT
jgi:hypothetical protein